MGHINSQSEQARENARKSNGEFGSYEADESAVTLDSPSATIGTSEGQKRLDELMDTIEVSKAHEKMHNAGISEITMSPRADGNGHRVSTITDDSGNTSRSGDLYHTAEEIVDHGGGCSLTKPMASLGWETTSDGEITLCADDDVPTGFQRRHLINERNELLEEAGENPYDYSDQDDQAELEPEPGDVLAREKVGNQQLTLEVTDDDEFEVIMTDADGRDEVIDTFDHSERDEAESRFTSAYGNLRTARREAGQSLG